MKGDSEWTPDTLYRHFEMRFKEAGRALDVARESINYRLEGMNEFRESLNDQNRLGLPRSEADVRFNSIEKQLNDHAVRLAATEGRRSGLQTGWAIFMGLAVLAISLYAALAGS